MAKKHMHDGVQAAHLGLHGRGCRRGGCWRRKRQLQSRSRRACGRRLRGGSTLAGSGRCAACWRRKKAQRRCAACSRCSCRAGRRSGSKAEAWDTSTKHGCTLGRADHHGMRPLPEGTVESFANTSYAASTWHTGGSRHQCGRCCAGAADGCGHRSRGQRQRWRRRSSRHQCS